MALAAILQRVISVLNDEAIDLSSYIRTSMCLYWRHFFSFFFLCSAAFQVQQGCYRIIVLSIHVFCHQNFDTLGGRMGERGERTEKKKEEVERGVGGSGRGRMRGGGSGVTENGVLRGLMYLDSD